ncbi:GNAT family N-acetyltransferase [Aegicerativicinus sediminis]|uniref:GNAT family N-acetyltransferase n=1 Tax=Aegicerativicinus sediminis TaxID=2893202 RepID=UPI001E402C81|nr:GNAT family N-acetyltransferase [Aegicerativicinus sediminis]
MSTNQAIIREISLADNKSIAKVIREVLIEMGVPKVGTAYADSALDCMYETYDHPRCIYFLAIKDGEVVGGCGISPLQKGDPQVCELQKMYILNRVRGEGIGKRLIDRCLHKAKEFKFKSCYLETMPYMERARRLYAANGFNYIDGPMGDTGHYSCNVWMLKDL